MKNLLKLFSTFLALCFYSITLWASTIEKFDIQTAPTKVKVWESVDITVKALDKDGNVVKDYEWEVLIFSQSDPKAEFPWVLTQNTYKFKIADAGQVKFENAVKFTKAGTQDINVYDTSNEDIFWLAEVEVTAVWDKPTTEEITIKSPENWVTLWTDSVKVSGTTLKNHKIKITLNTDKDTSTTSNADWVFESKLTWVPSWENFVVAKVLDADGKVIWESTKILFKIESNAPKFKSIKINPEWEVAWDSVLNVSVEATNWLTDVQIILNDLAQKLTEWKAWVYTGSINAPKDNWDYKIDVTLKNELWIESKENWAASITVKNVELAAAPIEETATGVNCDDLKKELVVGNVKLVKMKSKSVLSWDKIEKATSYNIYKKDKTSSGMVLIENITENQLEINIEWDVIAYDDFAVKAVLKNESCEIEGNDFSSMTKVQTWPREFILIILSLLMVWLIFFFRRKTV